MLTFEEIEEILSRGINLYHEVEAGLDVTIHPANEESADPGAYMHIGGVGGNVLGLRFKDNDTAAHFFFGFQGIKEVTEM